MKRVKLSLILSIFFALWALRIAFYFKGYIDASIMFLISLSLYNESRK